MPDITIFVPEGWAEPVKPDSTEEAKYDILRWGDLGVGASNR